MQVQLLFRKALLLTTIAASKAPIPVQDLVHLKALLDAEGSELEAFFEVEEPPTTTVSVDAEGA